MITINMIFNMFFMLHAYQCTQTHKYQKNILYLCNILPEDSEAIVDTKDVDLDFKCFLLYFYILL